MIPFTADELVILVKARDILGDKRLAGGENDAHYRLSAAHAALLSVMRNAYLDTRDESPK